MRNTDKTNALDGHTTSLRKGQLTGKLTEKILTLQGPSTLDRTTKQETPVSSRKGGGVRVGPRRKWERNVSTKAMGSPHPKTPWTPAPKHASVMEQFQFGPSHTSPGTRQHGLEMKKRKSPENGFLHETTLT